MLFPRLLVQAVTIAALVAATAPTKALEVAGLSAEQVTAIAVELQANGHSDEAAALLAELERDGTGGVEREFAQGLLALERGEHAAAAARFRDLLARHPELTRVRLELARTLFSLHDDAAAEYHFRLALAADLPDDVRNRVAAFRRAIRERRTWQLQGGLSVAPDSNINAGSAHDSIELLGLPFELDEASRSRSGIGLAASLNASYRWRRDTRLPLYVGFASRSVNQPGAAFDDDYARLGVGPEIGTALGKLRILLERAERRFGETRYQSGRGIALELDAPLTHRWSFGGRLELRDLRHPQRDYLDGRAAGVSLSATRALGHTAIVSAWVGLDRANAADAAYANRTVSIGAGFTRELRLGLTAGVSAEIESAAYEGALAPFGAVRRDGRTAVTGTLYKRDWSWRGFAPVFRLSYSAVDSTLDLFEHERWRSELNVTRTF